MEFNNINDIKELINIIDNSKLMDFELKLQENIYIKMSKQKFKSNNFNNFNNFNSESQDLNNKIIDNSNNNTQEVIQEAIQEVIENKTGELVKSPIVGTFYSSSSPDQPSFVSVGDKVKKGDVLCIVEAMKVMNEIKSLYDGEVAEILVNNEDMVEYNQALFRII
ncbi:MAG: acetyl-CoA carboxylase biotin carboxyl carrier protein [bacterium]